jgi:hypothetical protein
MDIEKVIAMKAVRLPPENSQLEAKAELKKFVTAMPKKWDLDNKEQGVKETWALLKHVYKKVRSWQRSGKIEDVVQKAKKRKKVKISDKSSAYLAIFRCAYRNDKQKKRMSAWASALEYAESENIKPRDFESFLLNSGGIDGARREMAKIRKKVKGEKKADAAKTAKIKKKTKLSDEDGAPMVGQATKVAAGRRQAKSKAKKGKRPSTSAAR